MTPEGYPETVEEYQEFLAEISEMFTQFNAQQQQPAQSSGDQGGPSMNMDMMDMLGGGAGAGTGGSSSVAGGPGGVGGGTSSFLAGGEGGSFLSGIGTVAPYIAAAIFGQHEATKANKRDFEGQKTGDVFSGNFATEPWFAALTNKLGLNVTAGEKFDAAVKNKDTSKALKRLPAAADYWADPIRKWISTGSEYATKKITGSSKVGKVVGKITDPIGALLELFGK